MQHTCYEEFNLQALTSKQACDMDCSRQKISLFIHAFSHQAFIYR